MASIVSGSLIATLVALGSTCGTWVAVTAAAVADPKPVAGPTSAAWGYPVGRRSHMESRSRPVAGYGAVCLKRSSAWISFRQDISEDIIWQLVVGAISLLVLVFKYPLRAALGFPQFSPPQQWVFWLGIAATALATVITIQIPIWAWSNGGRWSFLHGCTLVVVEGAALGLRLFWRSQTGLDGVCSFWTADTILWVHNSVGSLFSLYLSESTEYPVNGWLWPTAWLLAVASTGAGIPRYTAI